MNMHRDVVVDYNVRQLEKITVEVPESEYNRLIRDYAVKQVKMADVSKWGYHVELHKEHDGVGIETAYWAEVIFTRLKPEEG